MTTLRDKAIAAVEAVGYLPIDAEEIVDALLAAGMLTDPEEGDRLAVKAWRRARDVADGKPLPPRDDEARDAGKALDARLLPESDKEYCRRIEEIAAGGHPLVELPRDDEARIERAARALHDYEQDVRKYTSAQKRKRVRAWADANSYARDSYHKMARVALAAADQEPTNSDAAPEGAAPPATRYVGDQHTADQEPTDG